MKKFILIFCLAFLLRIWRLPELATFNFDEARDAMAEKSILDGKLTLLGPETKIGQQTIYFGPFYYYIMAPALKLANYNPLGTYYWTAFLGAMTAVVLAAGFFPAAGLFYAVFPLSVIYNRWAWNPNLVPLFAALGFLLIKRKYYFFAGLAFGLMVQFHYMAAICLLVALIFSKRRLAILGGVILGLLPLIIFDLRHNFFLTSVILSVTKSDVGTRTLGLYYFLWVPVVVSIMLKRTPKRITAAIISLSLVATTFWLLTQKPDYLRNPFWRREVAKLITIDQKSHQLPFNVAAFIDGDARATAYRYYLELEGEIPLRPQEYDVADHLYVITTGTGEEVINNSLYEVASFKPVKYSLLGNLGGANVYRLNK